MLHLALNNYQHTFNFVQILWQHTTFDGANFETEINNARLFLFYFYYWTDLRLWFLPIVFIYDAYYGTS